MVAQVGEQTLDELERLVGLLACDDAPCAVVPPASLVGLDVLVAQTRRGGLPVTVHVEGKPMPLPMAIDASAYRIIQESLTNALKYAGHAPTSVTVRFDSDGLGLEVVNDAGDESGGAHAAGTGHGIVGMRERAAMHNGSLEAGPQPSGGFSVRARLPVPTGSSAGRARPTARRVP
jgi:signal transduction histidine kinase